MRFIPALAVLGVLFVLSAPAFAEENADPLFVPPPPAPTEPVPDWLKFQDPYTDVQNNLSTAHRTSEEIIIWVSNTAAEAMTFSPDSFNTTLTEVKKKFNAKGWNEYANWLKESQLADMVRTQHLGVSTIANGNASILNSGTVEGSYHWLIDVPVIIAFTRNDAEGEQETINGGKYRLSMQIGRVATGADDVGVTIEGWKITEMAK